MMKHRKEQAPRCSDSESKAAFLAQRATPGGVSSVVVTATPQPSSFLAVNVN